MQIGNQTDKQVQVRILGVPSTPEQELALACAKIIAEVDHFFKLLPEVLDRLEERAVERARVAALGDAPPVSLDEEAAQAQDGLDAAHEIIEAGGAG